jgi:hypothetical protein
MDDSNSSCKFQIAYQNFLQLGYVDELLETTKRLFSTAFEEQLKSTDIIGGDYSSFDPLFDRAWKTLEEKYSKVSDLCKFWGGPCQVLNMLNIFCRIDKRLQESLRTQRSLKIHYMVLKLNQVCLHSLTTIHTTPRLTLLTD